MSTSIPVPNTSSSESDDYAQGAIVVVAKCPIPGSSKTRLIPLLGREGSTRLAEAMLKDVLSTLTKCSALAKVHKIILYAPANDEGRQIMQDILGTLEIDTNTNTNTNTNNHWRLWPMLSRQDFDLTSSHLGLALEDALCRARNITQHSVVFLGMDAPELSLILEDIQEGLRISNTNNNNDNNTNNNNNNNVAMLCPADDGGYAMLCVPPQADASRVFAGVHWSHPLTAVSQLKALTDQNHHPTTTTSSTLNANAIHMTVHIGRLLHDIDEPQDVKRLCERLRLRVLPEGTTTTTKNGEKEATDHGNLVLYQTSNGGKSSCVSSHHPECYFTRQALLDLNQL